MKHTNKNRLKERPQVLLRHLYFRNLMLLLVALIAFGFTDKVGNWRSAEEQEWILIQEKEGVKAYYQFNSCDNGNSATLKFDNTNPIDVLVAWDLEILVSGEYFFLEPRSLSLKAGEIVEGSCTSNSSSILLINLQKIKEQGVGEDLSFAGLSIIKVN